MLVTTDYNRANALAYAQRWAFDRNPLFSDYTGRGGDCTSFVSQSIYAGGCTMNFTPDTGWYFITDTQRAAAWTGVEFFYNFITQNNGIGPFGREVFADEAIEGDVIQLADDDGFYHTLLITGADNTGFLVAAHSDDAYNRPLSTYNFLGLRYIHIDGIRFEIQNPTSCFDDLIAGLSIGIA